MNGADSNLKGETNSETVCPPEVPLAANEDGVGEKKKNKRRKKKPNGQVTDEVSNSTLNEDDEQRQSVSNNKNNPFMPAGRKPHSVINKSSLQTAYESNQPQRGGQHHQHQLNQHAASNNLHRHHQHNNKSLDNNYHLQHQRQQHFHNHQHRNAHQHQRKHLVNQNTTFFPSSGFTFLLFV